jgi:hypothetical protein
MKHKFVHTTIEHHDDGSATIHHEHEDGKSHVKHAVADLDEIHDSLEEHLRDPEEIEKEVKDRGVDPEALEEVIEPGLHDKALDYLADKDKVKPDDIEEKVSPGIHQKMERLIED